MSISEVRNHYRTGDISVYPLVINSENPKAGKLKVVSGRKSGKWMQTDHYGEYPMNTWRDIFDYVENQIDKLSKLNALSKISWREVKDYWLELNPAPKVINAPDADDIENLRLSESGIDSIITYIDDSETDPRFQYGFWEPIVIAWKSSLEKMKDEYESGKLADL